MASALCVLGVLSLRVSTAGRAAAECAASTGRVCCVRGAFCFAPSCRGDLCWLGLPSGAVTVANDVFRALWLKTLKTPSPDP